jgi:hypothetical protein
MGKLDTLVVNGPEDDVFDWGAVDWRRVEDDVRRLRQRIFTATQDRPWDLLEPVAWKAGMAGSEGAGAQQCTPATRRAT